MPGESHALVGRNGAGKSTLVAVMTGLREPDAGEIRFSGEASPPISDREAWRQRVACVTVAENLMVNRQPTRHGLISWGGLRRRARWL
jgi:simple sugar transport system ATP-binding protein